jgi:hypothetical protein
MVKTHAQPAAASVAPAHVARATTCACGRPVHGGGQCDACRKRAARSLQRESHRDEFANDAPALVGDVVRSDGDPLDSRTRTFFESRFGQDLGRVRVHTGARAAASARAVDAQAYAVGSHVVFDAGRFNPASGPGRELLAHELVHTLQQRGVEARDHDFHGESVRGAGAGEAASEREAASIAQSVAAGEKGQSRPAVSEPLALRRQSNAAATTKAGPSGVPPVQIVPEVALGKFTDFRQGFADARLDRRPALATGQPSDNPPPCQLDLFLKLSFDFHLGPSPFRDPETGVMSEPGGPWLPERANRWRRDYMRVAQDMWRTRHPLERKGDCPNEPCKRAIGQLRVVDADTMTDSAGQPVPDGISKDVHFPVKVFEFRPVGGKDYSLVDSGATMYAEDILPFGTAPPADFDSTKFIWRPGAAAHETGHMLGRPDIGCPPGSKVKKSHEQCYGEGSDRQNLMGRGTEFSREDHAPFIAGMKAATNCDWEVPSGGLPWWAYLLIGLTGVGLIVLGILALAGAL